VSNTPAPISSPDWPASKKADAASQHAGDTAPMSNIPIR
jgi:hypothetical protein